MTISSVSNRLSLQEKEKSEDQPTIRRAFYKVNAGTYPNFDDAITDIRSIAIVLGVAVDALSDENKLKALATLWQDDQGFEAMSVAANLGDIPDGTDDHKVNAIRLKKFVRNYTEDFRIREDFRLRNAPQVDDEEDTRIFLDKTYRVAYGCVLQSLCRHPTSGVPKNKPSEFHDLIWSDQAGDLAEFRMYDDDSVSPLLYAKYGFSGTTVNEDLEDWVDGAKNGDYIISINTAGLDGHMVYIKVQDGDYLDKQDPQNRVSLKRNDTVVMAYKK